MTVGLVIPEAICLDPGGLGAIVTTPEIDSWYDLPLPVLHSRLDRNFLIDAIIIAQQPSLIRSKPSYMFKNLINMFSSNKYLVIAIILQLAHIPLPWGHTHAGMDSLQLLKHLDHFHANVSSIHLPQGWHWHLFLSIVEEGEDSTRKSQSIICPNLTNLKMEFRIQSSESFSIPTFYIHSFSGMRDVSNINSPVPYPVYLNLNVLRI